MISSVSSSTETCATAITLSLAARSGSVLPQNAAHAYRSAVCCKGTGHGKQTYAAAIPWPDRSLAASNLPLKTCDRMLALQLPSRQATSTIHVLSANMISSRWINRVGPQCLSGLPVYTWECQSLRLSGMLGSQMSLQARIPIPAAHLAAHAAPLSPMLHPPAAQQKFVLTPADSCCSVTHITRQLLLARAACEICAPGGA